MINREGFMQWSGVKWLKWRHSVCMILSEDEDHD